LKRRIKLLAAGLLVAALSAAVLVLWNRTDGSTPSANDGSERSLSAWLKETEAYFPAESGEVPLRFPDDFGFHPRAPLESWEFSGMLATSEGRRFGFQWSLMRLGLRPDQPERKSAWASRAVYRGVLALGDAESGKIWAFERYARAALGLAGADERAQKVWLENWTMSFSLDRDGLPRHDITAASNGVALKLRLRSRKAPIVPGDSALPGPADGAWRAFFLSRMELEGTVALDQIEYAVTGQAWLNRTWGRIAPPGGQSALNRFHIQLDDGREISIFQFHRRDASAEPLSSGFWIASDGAVTAIAREDLLMQPSGEWSSTRTGARYPVRWKIRLPRNQVELEMLPLLEDQELAHSRRSWSGAFTVRGQVGAGRQVSGSGFADLTGY
jgi:predicted secreted hydrolase